MKNFIIQSALNKLVKPQLVTVVEIFVNGKLKRKFFGESVNANFLQFLYARLGAASASFVASPSPFSSNENIIAHGGGTTSGNTASWQTTNATPLDYRGIIFGTGARTLAPNVTSLQTPIRHGTSSGQLQYQVQEAITGVTISGANSSFILQRLAQNLSGATITISELGIYTGGSSFAGGDMTLIYYDVPTSLAVLNNETVTCQITFRITT